MTDLGRKFYEFSLRYDQPNPALRYGKATWTSPELSNIQTGFMAAYGVSREVAQRAMNESGLGGGAFDQGEELTAEYQAAQDKGTSLGTLLKTGLAAFTGGPLAAAGAYVQARASALAPRPSPAAATFTSSFAPSTGAFPMGETDYGWTDLGRDVLRAVINAQPSRSGGDVMLASYGPAMPMQTAFPALPALGSFLGGTVARAGAAAVGIIRTAAGRIAGWVLPSGVRVSRKQAVELAKNVGITAAAGALGASAVELAEAIMQEEGRPRRGRGITAAQLRTTRRTMRKVESMHRQIAKAAKGAARCR